MKKKYNFAIDPINTRQAITICSILADHLRENGPFKYEMPVFDEELLIYDTDNTVKYKDSSNDYCAIISMLAELRKIKGEISRLELKAGNLYVSKEITIDRAIEVLENRIKYLDFLLSIEDNDAVYMQMNDSQRGFQCIVNMLLELKELKGE